MGAFYFGEEEILSMSVGDKAVTSIGAGTDEPWTPGGGGEFEGLCFTANTAGSTITLNKIGSPSWTGSYSTNGSTWKNYTPGTTGALTLSNIGSKVYFKGSFSSTTNLSNYLQFSMTGSIASSGNILSLSNGDDFSSITTLSYYYIFYQLF